MSVKPTIFREYIGSNEGSNHDGFPTQIINENVKEFHFVVLFSKESYEDKNGSGNFDATWDITAFNGQSIEKVKSDTNAKVILSIGGPANANPFNPIEKNAWLSNAKQSLTEIITDYKFDGIDINYETIYSSTEDFNFCIGGLIKHLKDAKLITFASIAPSKNVNPHYNSLFKSFNTYINWVDYKFYSHHLPTKDEFTELYNKLSRDYRKVLIAGYSSNPKDDDFIKKGTFIDGCKELIGTDVLPGISVSDADYSKPRGYEVEKLAQNLIVKSK